MRWDDLEHQFGEFQIPADEPVFPLMVVCRLIDMNYWTLHEVMRLGLIEEKAKKQKKKLFTQKEIKRLKIIKYLMDEKGVNLAGIKVIFEMEDDDE